MNVLIAEDDESIMTSYKLLLRSRNHELFTASDGDECLMIFEKIRKQGRPKAHSESRESRSTPFDMVILDYRMPKKDGLQVARHILSVVPDQRIIIASAYTHELIANDLTQNPNYRKVEMLQKPFGFDILLRLVEGDPELPQRRFGQKSSASEGHMPSPAEFKLENDRLDDERFTRMDKNSDDVFRTPF